MDELIINGEVYIFVMEIDLQNYYGGVRLLRKPGESGYYMDLENWNGYDVISISQEAGDQLIEDSKSPLYTIGKG